MLIRDVFNETLISLTTNKVRSGLTMLGIVIGIGSVIAMISIGQGAQLDIEKRIQASGSNLIMIRPGFSQGLGQGVNQGQGSAQSLNLSDVDAIKKAGKNISFIAPSISKNLQAIANGKNTRTNIIGTTTEYISARNVSLARGVFFSNDQNNFRAKVAVIGPEIKNVFFADFENVIGQKIRINNIDFTIIGTTISKGGSGFGNEDDVIYIPLLTMMQYLTGDDALSLISVTVSGQDKMNSVSQNITQILFKQHNINNEKESDFRVMNQADIVSAASSITNTFTLLLGSVAGISLVVGGIGIMNMMLTTVTERTREIGLRKAIGAKRRDINKQFIFEAIILTFFGGIFGIIFGVAIAFAFEKVANITTQISIYSILLAFGVSAFIGIIFGFYPARRAANLNSIEALRYE